jgi:hypothetical protein
MSDHYNLIHAHDKRIAALEEQNVANEAKLTTIMHAIRSLLPQPAQTPPPRDPTDRNIEMVLRNAGGEMMRQLVEGVPDDVMRAVAKDNGIGRR